MNLTANIVALIAADLCARVIAEYAQNQYRVTPPLDVLRNFDDLRGGDLERAEAIATVQIDREGIAAIVAKVREFAVTPATRELKFDVIDCNVKFDLRANVQAVGVKEGLGDGLENAWAQLRFVVERLHGVDEISREDWLYKTAKQDNRLQGRGLNVKLRATLWHIFAWRK